MPHHVDTAHDEVIPHTTVDPEKEIEKELENKFDETNWWVRAWLFPPLFFGLMSVCFISYVLKREMRTVEQVQSMFLLTLGFIFFTLIILLIIKYFTYVRPWKKFKEDWSIRNTPPSVNVGGILKIWF